MLTTTHKGDEDYDNTMMIKHSSSGHASSNTVNQQKELREEDSGTIRNYLPRFLRWAKLRSELIHLICRELDTWNKSAGKCPNSALSVKSSPSEAKTAPSQKSSLLKAAKKCTKLCVEPHSQDFSFNAYTNKHSTWL